MELLYHTLGFNPPPGIPSSGYKTISGEELISLDPDHILFLWSSKAGMDYLVKQPYWKDLKAVRNNNIHIPNSMEWDPWGPLGRKNMIKQLVSYFQQKKLLV
jgi:ABC-type Fe3+-hydroxamate transport system substrate-binding protein